MEKKIDAHKGFLPSLDSSRSHQILAINNSANTGQSLSLVNSDCIIIIPDFNDVILVYFQCELLVFQSTAFVVASVNGIIQASHDCSNLLYTTK